MRKLKNVVAVIGTSEVYTEHVYHCTPCIVPILTNYSDKREE